MKVLVFGSCNIDYVYRLDHIVEKGETVTTCNFEIFPGGKGLNQSIAAAKAGADVYFAGCVGKNSEILTDILSENNVDISLIDKVAEKNGHAIIQVDRNGENSIFLYPGSNEKITKEYVDFVLGNFNSGDFILLQNEINNLGYIVEKAFQKGMQIVLNPSPFNEKLNSINFNHISYLILNEVELKTISQSDNIKSGLKLIKSSYPNIKVMLTLGENGCVYTDNETKIYRAAYDVDVIDTTAAGDTFTGYFVAELTTNKTYEEILKFSSAASALSISKKGAAVSIPDRKDVISNIKNLGARSTNFALICLQKTINCYINQNIKTANLKDLSELLGYSTDYTGKLVKKLTGKPFSEVLQIKRCQSAAEKLLNTDLSISQIIEQTGYKNENFFRTKFKSQFGKNPLEYRKNKF